MRTPHLHITQPPSTTIPTTRPHIHTIRKTTRLLQRTSIKARFQCRSSHRKFQIIQPSTTTNNTSHIQRNMWHDITTHQRKRHQRSIPTYNKHNTKLIRNQTNQQRATITKTPHPQILQINNMRRSPRSFQPRHQLHRRQQHPSKHRPFTLLRQRQRTTT